MIVVATSLILLAIILSTIWLTIVFKSSKADLKSPEIEYKISEPRPMWEIQPMQDLRRKAIQGQMVKDTQRRLKNESI